MGKKTKQQQAVELLTKLAREGMAKVSPMTSWERGFEEEARKRGQAGMDARLAELPPEDGKPKACPLCGKRARVRARGVARTFKSMWGEHTVVRDYHYCEVCNAGFYPRDEFLGLPKSGDLTDEVESRIADFAVNDVYQQAQARWRFHYRSHPVSDNQFRQVSKRLGAALEESNAHVLEGAVKAAPTESSERLYVMSDGGMVPMQHGEWREVKVGVLFREENHSRSDGIQRGLVSEARYAAVLGNQEEFKAQLRAALDVENACPANEVVWLADGAPANWLLAGTLVPKAIQVLDWCHALEHAVTCGKALLGESGGGLSVWKRRAEELLWAGELNTLFAELTECRALSERAEEKAALDNLLAYYRTNKCRMAYAEFRERGLLIGSGIVESAHRHVIQTRMKKAGQHWSEKGGRQMARMRAAYRTAGPEGFYAAVRWANRMTRRTKAFLPKPHKVDLRRNGMANRR